MKNDKRGMITAGLTIILALYMIIVMYVFFVILHVQIGRNFGTGIFFELVGFAFLIWLVYGKIISNSMKTGYLISLVLVTLLYTVTLDVLNFWAIFLIPSVFFVLIHLILLFVYGLVSIPMFIMGKK